MNRTRTRQTFFRQRRRVCQGLLTLGLGLVACQGSLALFTLGLFHCAFFIWFFR